MIAQESTPCALEGTAAAGTKVRWNKDPYASKGPEGAGSHSHYGHHLSVSQCRYCARVQWHTQGSRECSPKQEMPAKRGQSVKKSPFCSIYHHACYPEPNQGTNAWPLVIFQNFAYAVLSTQDRHQDKTRGRRHFFRHNPSSEGACSRTRERTCKCLTCGKICLSLAKVYNYYSGI